MHPFYQQATRQQMKLNCWRHQEAPPVLRLPDATLCQVIEPYQFQLTALVHLMILTTASLGWKVRRLTEQHQTVPQMLGLVP
jgi:hypothetical protein